MQAVPLERFLRNNLNPLPFFKVVGKLWMGTISGSWGKPCALSGGTRARAIIACVPITVNPGELKTNGGGT